MKFYEIFLPICQFQKSETEVNDFIMFVCPSVGALSSTCCGKSLVLIEVEIESTVNTSV